MLLVLLLSSDKEFTRQSDGPLWRPEGGATALAVLVLKALRFMRWVSGWGQMLTPAVCLVSAVHAGPGSAGSDVEPGSGCSAEDFSHADDHEAASAASAAAAADLLHGGSGSSQTVRAPAAAARPAPPLQHRQEDQIPQREDAGLLLGAVVQDRWRPGCDGRQDEETSAGWDLSWSGPLRWAPGPPVWGEQLSGVSEGGGVGPVLLLFWLCASVSLRLRSVLSRCLLIGGFLQQVLLKQTELCWTWWPESF